MNTLNLLKKLISIPSYVDSVNNEVQIAKFIFRYLKKNTKLVVEKSPVEGNRFNVIAYSKSCKKKDFLQVDILFIDHIDTVQPKQGCLTEKYVATRIKNKLYGLGTADTKSNVAVLMKLAERIKDQKIMFLFYVDEEYEFKGMYSFIGKYKKILKSEKIISTDGENLKIRNCCRGLIEIDIECLGKSGHSANQTNGNNVLIGFNKTIGKLEELLKKNPDKDLGSSTLNISYLRSGLFIKRNKDVTLGKNGNNIPDFLEATLEIRTNRKINLQLVINSLNNWFLEQKIKFMVKKITHNLNPWYSYRSKLKYITDKVTESIGRADFTDPSRSGYVDLALLVSQFKSTSCCIGTIGGNRHGANEWVQIDSINSLEQILEKLL